jgi:hypothetical protein
VRAVAGLRDGNNCADVSGRAAIPKRDANDNDGHNGRGINARLRHKQMRLGVLSVSEYRPARL